MYYFRCLIGAMMLGMAMGQGLHFTTGAEKFTFGDAVGISFLGLLGVVGLAPAIVEAVRGEGRARVRGIIVLVLALVCVVLIIVGIRLTPGVEISG